MMADPMFSGQHFIEFFAGATGLGIVAHAVNTMPTPKNPYGQWLLGIVKFIVGQRVSAVNAINGLQTEATAVTTAQKEALSNGSTLQVVRTPEGILKPITSQQPLEEAPKGN